jgi:hypothetical protein
MRREEEKPGRSNAPGTKKAALFDILNRGAAKRCAGPPIASNRRSRYIGNDVAIARAVSHAR